MVEWSWTKGRITERGPYIFVEWSCANERNKSVRTLIFGRMVVHKRLNERGPYIFVEWSCAHKRNKSVGMTLNSGRMVVHIASAKIPEPEGSTSPYSFMGNCLTIQFVIFNPWAVPWNWIAFSQISFVISWFVISPN